MMTIFGKSRTDPTVRTGNTTDPNHDCGHPNMWMKIQTFLATGRLILLGGVRTWLHFRESGTKGIEIPLLSTAAAVGWKFVLGTLKSFYSH